MMIWKGSIFDRVWGIAFSHLDGENAAKAGQVQSAG